MYAEEQKPHFQDNVLSVFLVIFFQLKQQDYCWQLELYSILQTLLSKSEVQVPKLTMSSFHFRPIGGKPFDVALVFWTYLRRGSAAGGIWKYFFTSTCGHPVSYQKKLNRSRGSNWEKC